MGDHVAGGMTIQPATLGDLDAIEALEAAAFTGDRLSRRSLRAFVRAAHRPLIVARFGERVAGYALISMRRGGRAARIYSLAVDPAQGRRGVGRALLQACERYARAHGCDRAAARGALRQFARRSRSTKKWAFATFGHHDGYYEDGAAALRFEKRARRSDDGLGGVRRRQNRRRPPLARGLGATHGDAPAGMRLDSRRRRRVGISPLRSAREPIGRMSASGCEPAPRRGVDCGAAAMNGWVILVDHARDFPNAETPHKVITTSDYLARPKLFAGGGRAKVINLSRSYNYQSKGYYASLLAEARGHRVIPERRDHARTARAQALRAGAARSAGGADRPPPIAPAPTRRRLSICCSASAWRRTRASRRSAGCCSTGTAARRWR